MFGSRNILPQRLTIVFRCISRSRRWSRGAVIRKLGKNGVAETAGCKAGDIIVPWIAMAAANGWCWWWAALICCEGLKHSSIYMYICTHNDIYIDTIREFYNLWENSSGFARSIRNVNMREELFLLQQKLWNIYVYSMVIRMCIQWLVIRPRCSDWYMDST